MRRKVRVLLCLVEMVLMWLSASGEVFRHLDWSRFATLGEVPQIDYRLELGADYGDVDEWSVRVVYPEWEQMSKVEARKVEELGLEVGEEIEIEKALGVSRKRGVLEVGFLPIRSNGGKLEKLMSCKVEVERNVSAASAGFGTKAESVATSGERYVEHSVLSEGKWVKIRVEEEGIYSLSHAFLSELGFSDPSQVKLYGYGGLPLSETISYDGTDGHYDDLEEVPLLRRTSDMLFYATGTVAWSAPEWSLSLERYVSEQTRNPYSSYSYYFLTEGDEPMAFPTLAEVEGDAETTLTTYPAQALLETDDFSWLQSGRRLYDSYDFADGNSKTYSISCPGISGSSGSLDIYFSAGAYSTTSVALTLNGESVGSFSISSIPDEYTYAVASEKTYSVSGLGTTNTLNISTTSGNAAHLDYILVNYDRTLSMSSTWLPFSYGESGVVGFSMSSATSSTQIWRTGSAGKGTAVVPSTLNSGTLSWKLDDNEARYVAVNTEGTFPSPESVGAIECQDLHGDSAQDMVIIVPTSGKLTAQAERLAAVHREVDGLRVRIVSADEIYNEFSSGTPDATAYRKYLKMLYDRAEADEDMPRYLLLFGSCVWDNRMLTSATKNLDADDYLLSFESDEAAVSEVYSYVSDDYFGLLDDGEGSSLRYDKIDLGIGRLPATTADVAEIMVDKTLAYIENQTTGNWKNQVYMLADDGNDNSHMEDADVVGGNVEKYYPAMHVKRVYWDAYEMEVTASGNRYPDVTEELKTAMSKGALLMNYSGHGAAYTISHEQVLTLGDFEDFSSAKVPMWVVASCELTPFDMLDENIGETAMANSAGAAVAFYSSARAAYNTQNRYLNNYFMNYVLGQDEAGVRYTIGDAARLTKLSLVSTVSGSISSLKDYTINKLKYALMGDPALRLSMPTESVVIDSINGERVGEDDLPEIGGGGILVVSGHVETAAGVELDDFSGTVSLTLYDSMDTITCNNNQGDDVDNYVYCERTKTLYEGSDSVVGGRFSVSIPVPLDIKYSGETGLLNLYAVNNEKTIEANGYSTAFTLGSTADDALGDSVGPSIYVYLNTPDFEDGGKVNSCPYFYAELSDSSGINRTGNGIGHDLELIIDGEEELTYVLNDYYENDFGSYTSGTVSYQITDLEDGEHRLFFRAWDTRNNSSSRILNFIVDGGLAPTFDVELTQNPATSSTTFIITYDRPNEETNFVVDVYDCMGRRWWHHTESGSSSGGYYTIAWDLATGGGVGVPSGLYLYRVGLQSGESGQVSKTKKLIVHRQ